MEKIKVSPIEPRYIVRAIAKPGEDIENFDLQFLIQIGDTYYDLCPNKISIKVPTCDKIMMNAEIDLHDMIIDMPATMVDEEGVETKARFRLVAQHDFPGQHAIHSSSDINEVAVDGRDMTSGDDGTYTKSLVLEADGSTGGNKLTVQTIVHPKDKRAAEKQASRDQDEADLKSGKVTKEELRERNSYFAVDAEVDFINSKF